MATLNDSVRAAMLEAWREAFLIANPDAYFRNIDDAFDEWAKTQEFERVMRRCLR